MRNKVAVLIVAFVALALSFPAAAQSSADLEKVLTQLDTAATNFRSTQADFVWDQYQKVVDETDTQTGKVYFQRLQRGDHETIMSADITSPEKKILLFNEGKIRFYQPKIDQVTEYEAGKHRAEVESFLVLGFGSRGHDLLKAFDVKYGGQETMNGVRVAKLELTPKSDKVRNMFSKIILWVDPARGVSIQQQAFEPSGDYRTAKYSNFLMNTKLPEDVFKLKTTNKTKVIKPQ
jgi:outer membrane lipoprotein-sorting protein